MAKFKIGDIEIYWLNGGEFELDGGTMFGAVPKVLWSRKFPADNENYIKMLNAVLLIKTPDTLALVDTGLGNKLTMKQNKIFRVTKPWSVIDDLATLGITRKEIDYVILTHCDFDHAGGINMHDEKGQTQLTFPRAKYLIQKKEWHDVLHPCKRSAETYWPVNFNELKETENLLLTDGDLDICEGIRVVFTGGHTRGHQIVEISSQGETAVHMADLLPTHIHSHPLWIMAYDNFPLEVIDLKEKLMPGYIKKGAWFTFYHDIFMKACRFDERGKVMESC